MLDIKDDKSCHIRILYFDLCEEVMIHFSQKFFRSYLFYGYLGLSRDLVPNIRIRFVSILHLVRHCLRIPVDNPLLSKLIDATEALAVRDSDAGVMLSMNQFHARYGLLHTPECCQKPRNQESDAFMTETVQTSNLKKTLSLASLTDRFLLDSPSWESLANNEEDRIKEEAEHKLLFFQLDPGKKREGIIRTINLRRENKRSSSITPVASFTRKGSVVTKERRTSSVMDRPANSIFEKPLNPPAALVIKRGNQKFNHRFIVVDEKDVHLPPLPQFFKEMCISPSNSTSEDGDLIKLGGILSSIDSSDKRKPYKPLPQQSSRLSPTTIDKKQTKSAGPVIKLPSTK